MEEIRNSRKGFTLLELLVVVLIIGILASIALPQYKMAVTKAKVASILPLMRRWKDALMEYKLQHGSYLDENEAPPTGDILGVNWPSDWECDPNWEGLLCSNDYWECIADEEGNGRVYCQHNINISQFFYISMYQPDDQYYENFRNKKTCYADGEEAHKICKALGGKLPEGEDSEYILY